MIMPESRSSDFQLDVDDSRQKSHDDSRSEGCEYGQERMESLRDQYRTDGSSQREAAIDGEIGKIEYFIGDIYAQTHDRIDHALFEYAQY